MPHSRNALRQAVWFLAASFTLSSLCLAASKLTISPANPRQLSNSTLSFTASINGGAFGGPVRWSSSNPAVATIAGIGGTSEATLLNAGTTTITAVHGQQKASTLLTVTVAVAPVFTRQPADTYVTAAIGDGGGVQVQLLDNLGEPLSGQDITVSIGTDAADGGGAVQNAQGTLSGTLAQSTNSSGVAIFSDLAIDWLGNGYTLVASANPSSGPVSAASAAFNELRVGDACLGPTQPACSSACADTDLDGLNDVWETAGGVDLNGDGLITDSYHDVLLPGADPNRPDIYLKYDYMVTSTHSHKPPDAAWDQMKAMFANHGIALHVLAPTSGIPEHAVSTLDTSPQTTCAGSDYVTSQQLRAQYFGNLRPAYHYMIFAHDSTTPNDASLAEHCPGDALCGAKPTAGATGVAEVFGDDSIISFGFDVDNAEPVPIELWSSTMMHELGHNFGLGHGSLADPGNVLQEYCSNYKPNFISVMNYDYQARLFPAIAPGSITPITCVTDADCAAPAITSGRCATANTCFCTDDLGVGNNVCYRPDYAEDNLLNLNETQLDENVGVGGPSSLEDIVWYYYGAATLMGPSNGSPIDWNNDRLISDLTGCIGLQCPDINNNGSHVDIFDTTADWTQVDGQFIHFNFQFQCTAGYQNDVAGSSVQKPQTPKIPSGWPTEVIVQQ
jgi:hypothetical protein